MTKKRVCIESGCDTPVPEPHVRCKKHMDAVVQRDRAFLRKAKVGGGLTTPAWVRNFNNRMEKKT